MLKINVKLCRCCISLSLMRTKTWHKMRWCRHAPLVTAFLDDDSFPGLGLGDGDCDVVVPSHGCDCYLSCYCCLTAAPPVVVNSFCFSSDGFGTRF